MLEQGETQNSNGSVRRCVFSVFLQLQHIDLKKKINLKAFWFFSFLFKRKHVLRHDGSPFIECENTFIALSERSDPADAFCPLRARRL